MKTHLQYLLRLALALGLFVGSLSSARAFVGISVGIAPPPLPVCVQPSCPGDGYIWTPGYWAWDADSDDYYWVPGTWVMAPEVGLLWTPGYWGWQDGAYAFYPGYWGPTVGFYGGINYGYGYFGHGYAGGYWRDGSFRYNRAVNNVGRIGANHLYSREVARASSRVSFNGGTRGVTARATASELAAERASHIRATSAQNAQVSAARSDPALRYSANHGNPAVTGTTRAGEISRSGASERTASENATRTAPTEHANRTSAESAFTGESRTASENATRTAATERSNAERERTVQASDERRVAATRSADAERSASLERSRVAESRVSAQHSSGFASPVSHSSYAHAPSGGFHASSFHSSGGGGGAAHASAGHAGGGGGGGNNRH